MGPVYVVTNRSLDELLQASPEDYPVDFETMDREELRNDPPTGENGGVLVLDLSACPESNCLSRWEVVRNHPAVVALVEPDHVDRVQGLIDQGVRVYLHEPIGRDELRQSLEALRKNRKYMDPSLSDSLVERYLS